MGAPADFNIELLVIRVGDWGGYMMADCDDPVTVHKFCSMLPAFAFEARLSFQSRRPCAASSKSWHGAIVSEIQLRAVS
jgi:hypothetical protein